jgi:thioredoxin 1
MKEISADEFKKITGAGKVIVDFFSTGCGNCKMMEPWLLQLEGEHPSVTFVKFNAMECDARRCLADELGVTSLPTLLFYKDGAEVARMVSLKPKVLIAKKIQEVF